MTSLDSFFEHHPSLSVLVNLLLAGLMVFGPLIGYISQYREIKRTQSTGVFSIWICFILLVSNTLRVLYWLEERYEIALLLQSLCMLMAQLVLLELCVHVRKDPTMTRYRFPSVRNFWNWEEYADYISFIGCLALSMSMLTIFMTFVLHSKSYNVLLGYAALLIEATLGIPQLIDIYRNRSTKGLR
jgi:solute carrier family 66, member 2